MKTSDNSGNYRSALLRQFVPDRKFPFPKSLYAVEDTLRLFIQDGGSRQCISIMNNEVAAEEHAALTRAGLHAGDPDWEKWGICNYITMPRIKAAITGRTPEGIEIEGDYKFVDEFPISDGFKENVEFFALTYERPISVKHNLVFQRIAPLLWLRAGAQGRRIDELPENG